MLTLFLWFELVLVFLSSEACSSRCLDSALLGGVFLLQEVSTPSSSSSLSFTHTSQRVSISTQTSLLILREEEVFFYPSSMASMDNVIHSIYKTGHAEPEKFYLCIP